MKAVLEQATEGIRNGAPRTRGRVSVRIASVASAVPGHRFPQDVITTAFKGYWNAKLQEPEKLDWLHSRVGVDFRHLAFPLDRYPKFCTWGEANAAWLEAAEELGERAIDTALDRAGMSRQDLNALIVVSITGIASPFAGCAPDQSNDAATGYQAHTHFWHRMRGRRDRTDTGCRLCACLSGPHSGNFMRRNMLADDAAGGFFNGQFDCIRALWRWRGGSHCQRLENGPPKSEWIVPIFTSWSANPRHRFGILS